MIKKSKLKQQKTNSILGKAKPVSSLQVIISALLYGRSGTGKTTLSGTFPKPLLVIDIGEKGTDSISGEDGVDFIRITEWSEFVEIYWELKGGESKYKSVSVDSVHALQALAIIEAKVLNGKKEDDPTSQRDFGGASGLLNTWLPNYRDLVEDGIHVIFLAHDKVSEIDTDDDDGMILPEVGPRLMPSVAGTLLGIVNIVGHTFIREEITKSSKVGKKSIRTVQYCIRIGPHSYYATKIRRPKSFSIPEYIIDPTYDKLVNVIQGKTPSTTKRIIRKKS